VIGQGGDGQAFVQRVHLLDQRGVEHQQPGRLGQQVDAPGGGAAAGQQRAEQPVGDARGRCVLRHVALFEARGDHLAEAAGAQGLDGPGIQRRALLDDAARQPDGVGEDRAPRLLQPGGAEDHLPLRRATTCAMMDSAISGAVTAPMSRPTGAAMRSSAAPWGARRSSRLAWVRFEPRAPM
jgi:hypothetical protein